MAEEQVYQPERDEFDAVMNRHFLPSLMAHFWVFRTQAPVSRDPTTLVENVRKSLKAGAIDANEARRLLGDAFSVDFPFRKEDWAKAPPDVVLAAMRAGATGDSSGAGIEIDDDGEGDTLARGQTDQPTSPDDQAKSGADHTHRWTAILKDGEVHVRVDPGGDDGHVHEVTPFQFPESGQPISVGISGDDHSHSFAFTLKTKRRKRSRGGASAMALYAIREAVMEELDLAKSEWLEDSEKMWRVDADKA